MKPRLLLIALALLAALALSGTLTPAKPAGQPEFSPAATEQGIDVYFSPHGGCTEAVVAAIEQAKKSIKLQAYSFTSVDIAKAVVEAKRRGVDVVAVLDKSQRTEKYSSATFLHNEGVPVFIDAQHAIAHNEIILIDDRVLITGSFNFTKAADEHSAGNLLLLHDQPSLLAAYQKNFAAHPAHAQRYGGADGTEH